MKNSRVVAVVLFVAIGFPIAMTGWQTWTTAAESAKKSAVLALLDEIERTATAHYDESGTYPATIDEMAISVFPDGGNPAMLDEIHYASDGDKMTLEWREFRVIRPEAEQ
ncbi:hypothetical protein [Neorhodopirellula pilleata]|nr:hypothetical protein [Neorhodopirellula pilleata]